MNVSLKKYSVVALMVLALLSVGVRTAFAGTACSTDNGLSQISGDFSAQYCSAPTTISFVINVLLGFLAIISVLFIIVGGYRMVISSGNEESFTKGRQTVLYAVIGLVVAIFAFAIVSIVGKLVSSGSTATPPATTNATSTPVTSVPATSTTTAPTTTPPTSTTTIPPYVAAPTDTSTAPTPTLPPSIAAPTN